MSEDSVKPAEKVQLPVEQPNLASEHPNIVRGLIGLDQVKYETPLGVGNAENPSKCRDYAADADHPYKAWAWLSENSTDEELRNTCLFYHEIIEFAGRWQDKLHVTACTDRHYSPLYACER